MLVIMESYDDEEIVGIPRTKNWQEEKKKITSKKTSTRASKNGKEKKQELRKSTTIV